MAEDDKEGSNCDERAEMTGVIDWACKSSEHHEQEDLDTANP